MSKITTTIHQLDECEKHIGIFFNERSIQNSILHTLKRGDSVGRYLSMVHAENIKLRLIKTESKNPIENISKVMKTIIIPIFRQVRN